VDQPVTFITKQEATEIAETSDTVDNAAADAAVRAAETPSPAGGGSMRAGVEEAIEAIRPALQMDGGDVTLIGVDEESGAVEIELIGACVGCPASTMTLKAGIERILKDRVPGITEVNAPGLEPAFDF
jgi:Fe-S cluster biogenesis protein NfuA